MSYGVLAKRLHVSTSTLHRYCNGSTVPTEFAPVERLARLCKATPDELMEVHRQWIIADAARGRKAQTDGAPAGSAQPEPTAPPEEAPSEEQATPEDAIPEQATTPPPHDPARTPRALPEDRPRRGRRHRKAALAAISLVCVVGSAGLAVSLTGGGPGDDGRNRPAEASASLNAGAAGPGKSQRSGKGSSATPSSAPEEGEAKESGGPASAGPDATASAPSDDGQGHGDDKGDDKSDDVPLTVHTRPYAYESPCSQRYLVNRAPGEMPKPPFEQDAPAWVSELGAVSADNQFIKITLQGTGKNTVVLEGLNVRVDSSKAPLAWNAYETGVGCGGDVATRSFGVGLDAASPSLSPRDGQRDFPYKVSQNDPEVFYVKADARQHDVRWHLELQWSSGGRRGVLRIDDQGRPFHTSGAAGRPSYQRPPGAAQWGPTP
ncbi:helix-turn-helix domain-containing protein [Streptomyces griseocarneus]|uniref:helix-turn-helix domain-containing protein n=1 Tax=Streptomyces griseocarneus TaxID=51201 RepID=UPI001E335E98|nr:helix-turn-helix transcriptional regulator [Streptomyces griseocarneus]